MGISIEKKFDILLKHCVETKLGLSSVLDCMEILKRDFNIHEDEDAWMKLMDNLELSICFYCDRPIANKDQTVCRSCELGLAEQKIEDKRKLLNIIEKPIVETEEEEEEYYETEEDRRRYRELREHFDIDTGQPDFTETVRRLTAPADEFFNSPMGLEVKRYIREYLTRRYPDLPLPSEDYVRQYWIGGGYYPEQDLVIEELDEELMQQFHQQTEIRVDRLRRENPNLPEITVDDILDASQGIPANYNDWAIIKAQIRQYLGREYPDTEWPTFDYIENFYITGKWHEIEQRR